VEAGVVAACAALVSGVTVSGALVVSGANVVDGTSVVVVLPGCSVSLGSPAVVDSAGGGAALSVVGSCAISGMLVGACPAVDSGVKDSGVSGRLRFGTASGGRATVRVVAHGPPATQVSPAAAAAVINCAPSGAVSATLTRKDVVASDPAVPSTVDAGTSQAIARACRSSVSEPSASSPAVLMTVALPSRPERSSTTRAPSGLTAVSVYVIESPGRTSLPDGGSAVTVTLGWRGTDADDGTPANIGNPATTMTTTASALLTLLSVG
jgi:hypothetical protein